MLRSVLMPWVFSPSTRESWVQRTQRSTQSEDAEVSDNLCCLIGQARHLVNYVQRGLGDQHAGQNIRTFKLRCRNNICLHF